MNLTLVNLPSTGSIVSIDKFYNMRKAGKLKFMKDKIIDVLMIMILAAALVLLAIII